MRAIGRFVRQPGFILAAINFCIGLVWMVVIPPLAEELFTGTATQNGLQMLALQENYGISSLQTLQ